jgi:hypothetical protein
VEVVAHDAEGDDADAAEDFVAAHPVDKEGFFALFEPEVAIDDP